MKDAMPCGISPLGYHLGTVVKEKIWKGEFIDILSLLPFHKDFAFKIRGEKTVRKIGVGQFLGHLTIGCRPIAFIVE